jgi:hypothetical protein
MTTTTTTPRKKTKTKQANLSLWGMFKKMIGDSIQSESGNVDPARLQYFFTGVCGGVFIWGTIYDTLQNHHFNGTQFAVGAAGLATLMLGSAGGVRVKNSTELPLAQQGGVQPTPNTPGPDGSGQ